MEVMDPSIQDGKRGWGEGQGGGRDEAQGKESEVRSAHTREPQSMPKRMREA